MPWGKPSNPKQKKKGNKMSGKKERISQGNTKEYETIYTVQKEN
jgi:hypothetical protein